MAVVAVAVLVVASVCSFSLAHPSGSPGGSSFFHQYALALGETVTVQSPGFPTSVPPSAKYGWNVLCLPSESTALLISCYVNTEDTPLCYETSLTIKTDDENRRLCGKEYEEDFVSSTGFARFEFSSKGTVIGQGFICEAMCQAPEQVDTVSLTTPGTEDIGATEALDGEDEGTAGLETVTDDGAEDLETVTDDGAEDLETVTDDGAEDLETVTDDGLEDLETVTDSAEDLETVTDDDAEDLETVTLEDLKSVTDGAEDLESVTGGAESGNL